MRLVGLLCLLLASSAGAASFADLFERSVLNPGTAYVGCASGVCWTNDASSMRISNGHDAEQTNLLLTATAHWNQDSPGASTYPTSAKAVMAQLAVGDYCGPAMIDAATADAVACVTNGVNVKFVAIDNGVQAPSVTTTQAISTADRVLLEVSAANKFGCYDRLQNLGADILVGSIQTVANISTSIKWGMACFPASSL